MRIFIYTFLISISVLLVGCKSDDCTKMDANKAQQIEQQDTFIPWWAK